MSVTETLNEGLKRAYSLTIAATAIAARVDKAVAEVAPQVRMPGFRPGKVPANLIRRMHGEALRQQAIKEALDEGLRDLIAERSLRPATQPSVDLDTLPTEGEDLVVSVAMEVLPDIPETNIEGIALEKLIVEADDKAVEAALQRLAEQQKSFTDAKKTHKAVVGDLVVMDFAGSVDGVAFEGGTGEGMEIELGSGRLIPGFEDQLVGAKAGETRTVKLTIPADYPAEAIAGKDAEFKVTVTAVRVPEVPSVDDQMAVNLGLTDLAQLKDILKDQVESELAGLSRTYMKRKLLDHLAGDYGRIAERRVRLGLLLSEIGQKNGVAITQSEMNRLVAEEAARYPGQEQEVRKYFADNPVAAAQLRAPLFEEKVVDFLIGKAIVTERTVTREELESAIESEDETPLGASHGEPGHVHGPDCDHDHETPAKPKKAAKPKAAKAKAEPEAEAPAAEAETKPKKRTTKKAAAEG